MGPRATSTPRPDALRPRASLAGSIVEGWRRALGAPWVVGGVLAATWLFAWPLASAIDLHMGTALKSTIEGPHAADGPVAMTDGVLGIDGTWAVVSHVHVDTWPEARIVGAIAGYLAVSIFLSGGILDRLARGRPVGTGAFFSACGTYGVRFVRLSVLTAVAYWLVLRWLNPSLLRSALSHWVSGFAADSEPTWLWIVLRVIYVMALAKVSLIADFAKVRVVVEDRHSILGSVAASGRFIRRRWWRCAALYLMNAVAIGAILMVWTWATATAPAVSDPWIVQLEGWTFRVLGLVAMLAFMASEAVFFQGELAHAHYTAAPVPTWPESAAAEAIMNLTESKRRGGTAK